MSHNENTRASLPVALGRSTTTFPFVSSPLVVLGNPTDPNNLLIKRCMDADPTIRSYPDIGDRAFGKTGRIIVSVTMNIELYLVATGFLILEGDNLSNLLPGMDFDLYGIHVGGTKSFVVIVAAIILPTIWLNNMSILSYISASGVLASLIILGSIMWGGGGCRGYGAAVVSSWLRGLCVAVSVAEGGGCVVVTVGESSEGECEKM